MAPLEVDLTAHGGLREVRKKIQAYQSAWARLQHDDPGSPINPADHAFNRDLLSWLIFHNSMLIGEVVPLLYQYLQSNPLAPERTEYGHILVDEYQDLNKAEQGVIDLLSDNAEVCIVGDDDQSIYSFKYAHPEGIREWIASRPSLADLTLIECRRCPTRVTEMANSLIEHNTNRPTQRQLIPRAENGEGIVELIQFATLQEEVCGIVSRIRDLVSTGTPPGDILVLAQRSVIGTPIYQGLVNEGVPTISYYAESELESADAQKGFATLKLFVNRDDRVALRWLLGLGSPNWHSPAYLRLRQYSEATGTTPWNVLERLSNGSISMPYTQPLIQRFNELQNLLGELEQLTNLSAIIDRLFPSGNNEFVDFRELVSEVIAEVGEDDPVKFLSELTSAIAKPEVPSEIEDVRIMSLHKSKGLSAPITIIAGCVEGLLPKQPDPSLTQVARNASIEEQRRLFFVGVTRVKALPSSNKPGHLMLTYCQKMPIRDAKGAGISPSSTFRRTAYLNASRFIGELGPRCPRPVAG